MLQSGLFSLLGAQDTTQIQIPHPQKQLIFARLRFIIYNIALAVRFHGVVYTFFLKNI